jgi:hypothetical protein
MLDKFMDFMLGYIIVMMSLILIGGSLTIIGVIVFSIYKNL